MRASWQLVGRGPSSRCVQLAPGAGRGFGAPAQALAPVAARSMNGTARRRRVIGLFLWLWRAFRGWVAGGRPQGGVAHASRRTYVLGLGGFGRMWDARSPFRSAGARGVGIAVGRFGLVRRGVGGGQEARGRRGPGPPVNAA